MTFRVENHGVVKGVDEYHDLHGIGSGATCGELSSGTPNIHRVSHGCISWLFRKLSFPSTPVTLIGMAKESILFLLFEVANIEGCGMSILVERRNTTVDHKSNRAGA